MGIDEQYLNELLKYDFISSKKGRGYSSLLVQRKSKFANGQVHEAVQIEE